ncbi:hypothetical protein AB0333_15930 [Citricoccus sp. NPDC079358]|uniref:hypothetical protein n=1 Tax=Citricoccus sp. NPDC079358 TaxID=3154653 RepID=UPI00344D9A66
MSTQTGAGISRRTWRAAVIVFLTVLLAGTGLTGAAALWSVQGTVSTQVRAGTWNDPLRPGWTWTPKITATKREGGNAHHDIVFDWQPPTQAGSTVTYTTTLTRLGTGRIQEGPLAVDGDASAIRYTVHHQFLPDTFTFTVTATVDGVPSATVTRAVSIDKAGVPTIATATG